MHYAYLCLALAIMCEVVATSFLKLSEGFTETIPSVITVIGYGLAFYFLAFTLKYIPVGIAYAIWSGAGVVLIALIGVFVFQQKLDLPAVLGLAMITTGVLVINLFSRSVSY